MRILASIAILAALVSPATAGLIAEWDFDAHNAQDSSELSTDFDLATVSEDTGPTYDGGYAVFSGDIDDYLQTNGPGGASNFTVSLWVRSDNTNQGDYKGIFANNSGGSTTNFSWQIDNHNGSYRLVAKNDPPAAVTIGTPTSDQWDNIIIRKTGTSSDWYLNGTLVDSSTGHPGGLQMFRLGINRTDNNAYAMDLDRVQVWNSAEDAAAIFAAGRISGTPFNGTTSDLQLASNWDEGLPTNSGTNTIAKVGRGLSATITTGTGGDQFTKQLWVGFDGTEGTLDVTGGATRIGNTTDDGLYVGVGHGSVGTVNIAEGATLTSQGNNARVQIGDFNGGTGSITVAGELGVYKYIDVIDGTLTMMPTGVNNKFNSTNQSQFRAASTLEFVIDGTEVGSLEHTVGTSGLNPIIDASAQLAISLLGEPGDYTIGQEWTLMDYTSLTGEFAQGTSFTNPQGHQFTVDYGTGTSDLMVLTLVPESSAALLGLLGCGLLLRRRR